jgi:hypothetical protein
MTAIPTQAKRTVMAKSKMQMERRLEDAMSHLLERAMIHRDRGIMVTRHSPNEFTLELHPDIPFGVTRELDAWRKSQC